jgi:hypothetical protein
MRGVLPWLVRWACRASTRDFGSALAALVGLVENSVADPDPGSGAFLTLDPDPGSGIGFFPDP